MTEPSYSTIPYLILHPTYDMIIYDFVQSFINSRCMHFYNTHIHMLDHRGQHSLPYNIARLVNILQKLIFIIFFLFGIFLSHNALDAILHFMILTILF